MDRARRLWITLIFIVTALAARPGPVVAEATITFAAAGDLGASSRSGASLAKLNALAPNFFLAVGDLDYGDNSAVTTPTQWCDYVKGKLPSLGSSFPFQLVAGNHEEDSQVPRMQEFTDCLPDRLGSTGTYGAEYFFDYPLGNPLVRTIMISPGINVNHVEHRYPNGSTRYNWVESAIDGARSRNIPWVVAAMHYNCFTGEKSFSCDTFDKGLMNLLVAKRVDLVIQGHKHTYKRGKQLALSSSCASVAGPYNVNCIARDGANGIYSKGRGTIVMIIGTFGKATSDDATGYFIKGGGSSDGFSKFTLSATRLDASFVASTGSFTDDWSIVPNQPPTLTSPGNQDHAQGQSINVPVSAIDPEGDAVSFSATGLPPGLGINPTTGVISGTIPTLAYENSPYSVTVRAADPQTLASTATFNWIVRDLTPPAVPATVGVVRTTTGVSLDWPDNTEVDLDGYDVYRSSSQSGPFEKLNEARLASSSFFDASAPAGIRSYYEVRASDRVGNLSAPRALSVLTSKIRFVGATSARGSGMTLVLHRPPGSAPGDVLLAALSARGTQTFAPPAGWTLVSQVSHTSSMGHQAVYRHTVASSDPSSFTFRLVGRNSAVGMLTAYRGANQRPSASGGLANPVSKSITVPSIVASAADSVQVGFFSSAWGTSIAPPPLMVERAEDLVSWGRVRLTFALADTVVAAQTLEARVATAASAAMSIGQGVILIPA